jgi:prevent-host-death family protein
MRKTKRPTTVGSRELKTRLGTYLERVRAGETILVTDRGKPVAELRPVGASDDPTEQALRKMEAEGLITRPTRRGPLSPFRPVRLPPGVRASDWIVREREEGF